MADLTQTPANVSLTSSSDTQIQMVKYGEPITQGMPVYRNTSDNKYYKADKGFQSTSYGEGVAMTPGSTDEYGIIATDGPVDLGATLTLGETYVVSTAGAISPIGDLASTEYPCILGVATTTSTCDLNIITTGVAKA